MATTAEEQVERYLAEMAAKEECEGAAGEASPSLLQAPDGGEEGGHQVSKEEKKRAKLLASIRKQVSYYLSDENLGKGDAFLLQRLRESDDGLSVGLDVVCDFKKMRGLLRHCADPFGLVAEALDDAPGTTIVALEPAATEGAAPRVVRLTELSEDVAALLEAPPTESRTVDVRNLRNLTAEDDLRAKFETVGNVEGLTLGEDERGLPTCAVVYETDLGAIRAVEELNDVANWRFGLRVALRTGKDPAAARRDAKLAPLPKKVEAARPGDRRSGNTQAAPAGSPTPPVPPEEKQPKKEKEDPFALYPPLPEGRARGKLCYLKEGKYGFIRPGDATRKEDNAFFALGELNPKTLATKLKIGDVLDYTPGAADGAVGADGAPAKPKARDVRRAPRPKKEKKKKQEKKDDEVPASNDDTAAAAAPPPPPAEPLSKLEALALSVESMGPPKDGDDAGAAGARPDRLLGYGRRSLNLKPKSKHGHGDANSDDARGSPSPVNSGPSKIAKGPDGTTGFTRPRTPKPTNFKIDAAEFVPAFLA